jgi:site-specific recombinase XerD
MADTAIPFDDELIDSWVIALRAERKAFETIDTYRKGIRAYARWCESAGFDRVLSQDQFQAYLSALVESKKFAASTIATRHITVRQFSGWLAAEERHSDPLVLVPGPKVDEKIVQPLTDGELAALIGACRGFEFMDRRDEALARFIAECGTRASETLTMRVSSTNTAAGTTVVTGKGSKERIVGFGPQTARAMDRYLRIRRKHRLGDGDALWLGDGGKGFTYAGLSKAMLRRAELAEIHGFYLHRLRHTFADRWLERGGSEGGLMMQAGWNSRKMVDRYAKARAAARSLDEARRLELGDL